MSTTFASIETGPCTFCGGKEPPFLARPGDKLVLCRTCVELATKEVRRSVLVTGVGDELESVLASATEEEKKLYAERIRPGPRPNTKKIACSFCTTVPELENGMIAGPAHYICPECVGEASRSIAV
jgi:hypothetical protein